MVSLPDQPGSATQAFLEAEGRVNVMVFRADALAGTLNLQCAAAIRAPVVGEDDFVIEGPGQAFELVHADDEFRGGFLKRARTLSATHDMVLFSYSVAFFYQLDHLC